MSPVSVLYLTSWLFFSAGGDNFAPMYKYKLSKAHTFTHTHTRIYYYTQTLMYTHNHTDISTELILIIKNNNRKGLLCLANKNLL